MPYGVRLNPMFMALHSRLEMHIEPVLKNPGAQSVRAGQEDTGGRKLDAMLRNRSPARILKCALFGSTSAVR
jgi:hypothetical protein